MRIGFVIASLLLAAISLSAQTADKPASSVSSATSGGPSAVSPTIAASPGPSMSEMFAQLEKLQAASNQAVTVIGHMRIDKWKADGESKRQAQGNADSVQRNLTTALPGMIDAVHTAPQDLAPAFKLYRNLNALYDVMISLTESVGAFGPRSEYEALGNQLAVIDSVRRELGDQLERMTSATQSQVQQLREELRQEQQELIAARAAATPPKKTVVDDNAPEPKPVAKKKKPMAKKPPSTDSTAAPTSGTATTPDSASVPQH